MPDERGERHLFVKIPATLLTTDISKLPVAGLLTAWPQEPPFNVCED